MPKKPVVWTPARRLKYRQYSQQQRKKGASPAPAKDWLRLQYSPVKKRKKK